MTQKAIYVIRDIPLDKIKEKIKISKSKKEYFNEEDVPLLYALLCNKLLERKKTNRICVYDFLKFITLSCKVKQDIAIEIVNDLLAFELISFENDSVEIKVNSNNELDLKGGVLWKLKYLKK